MKGSLIEGVAKAIAKDRGFDWDSMEEECKSSWMQTAKAALKVLKHPSGQMLQASERALYAAKREDGEWFSQKAKHKIRYLAMIEVAMGEHKRWSDHVKSPDLPEPPSIDTKPVIGG